MVRLFAAGLAQIIRINFLEQRVLVALAHGLGRILRIQGFGAQGLQVHKIAHAGRLSGLPAAVYAAAGFPTLRVSAETGEGIEELKPLIAGKLSAFTGNSGVGKSSILNALDPAFQLQVGDVSQALGRGRHTTRHVELFHLSCGADVVDSPGFSSFETDELNLELKHRLPETFVEFRPYLDQCRFVGCSHTKEKGCAVLEAVRAGKIQRSRHASYVRLYEELKPLQDWQERKK